MTHYSPLRYPGGKGTLFRFLAATIRQNRLQPAVYVEPFAGGAGAAASLLLREQAVEVIINDIDPLLHCFWKSVIRDADALCEMIDAAELSVENWKKQRIIADRNRRRQKDRFLTVGFAAFYLNRCNRSGVFNGGPIGGLTQTGNYKIDARFNKTELIERVQAIAGYRERIRLFNDDAVNLLRSLKAGRLAPTNRSLAYLDPPYVAKGPRLYEFAFGTMQHRRLAAFLNRECAFRWVVSYDDCPEIHSLYSKQARNIYNMNYQVHTRRLGRELIVSSMNCELPGDEFLGVDATATADAHSHVNSSEDSLCACAGRQ